MDNLALPTPPALTEQVAPAAASGWCLVLLVAATVLLSVADQAAIVLELRVHVPQKLRFKTAAVVIQEFVFVAYGAVYLCSIFDLVSPLGEQVFYTYGDVWLKVVQASCLIMVRNWEDLAAPQATLELQVLQEDMSRLSRVAGGPLLPTSPWPRTAVPRRLRLSYGYGREPSSSVHLWSSSRWPSFVFQRHLPRSGRSTTKAPERAGAP